ncbi:MAG TPA: hypothetical protein VMV98_09185 [Acidobacteriaceae bacterium]|nr:hypothetical protein [Acidobacteriaceae bacterium]
MAVSFQQVSTSRLLISTSNIADGGWWAIQVPEGTTLDGKPVGLDTALNSKTLVASFIYSASAPDLTGDGLSAFIKAIERVVNAGFTPRSMILLATPALAAGAVQNPLVLGLAGNNPVTVNTAPKTIPLCSADAPISLTIRAGSTITQTQQNDGLIFDGGSNPAVSLSGLLSADTYQPDSTAVLACDGPAQGAFTYSLAILRTALKARLNWGFQTLIPNPNSNQPTITYFTAWLPLADNSGAAGADMLGFMSQVNPVNPNNQLQCAPTKFFFTGKNSGSDARTSLASFYRTNFGHPVTLYPVVDPSNGQQPAALVINNGYKATPLQLGFSLAPEGDYLLTVNGAAVQTPVSLMCGMTGTETISLLPFVDGKYPGYRLRFAPQQPALTPVFPLKSYSPISAPIDSKALLMNTKYVTSWASVIPPPSEQMTSPFYAAAPKGADLFARDTSPAANQTPDLLSPASPGLTLDTQAVFPLIPFAGFTAGAGDQDLTTDQLAQLERQILSPTRRSLIGKQSVPAPHAHHALQLAAAAAQTCPYNATTPAGFISRVECDGKFSQLLLAQVIPPGSSTVSLQMGFTQLKAPLQAAFQTDNMFLVVANADNLGTPSSGTFMPPGSQFVDDKNLFFNTISIGDWQFTASVGQTSQYSDYRNVMIVKGVRGKLTDLVLSPDKWTMKDVFAAPSTVSGGKLNPPDLGQLVPLSAWLNDYFQSALLKKENPYFQNFCNIIQSENWTGVLLLRVDIANVPSDLAGILAGVTDLSDFYAHHIGIEISQIDGKTVQLKDASSLFGLVYYVAPGYDDTEAAHPLQPNDLSLTYDFELLTLKALFTNSALTRFESLAQIVLNKIFGSVVGSMAEGGNLFNAILLEGAVQKHGDAAVYSLASTGTSVYNMANNVLTSVEIDSAVMSTRDDGLKSGKVVSWIALGGFMNFAILADQSGSKQPLPAFDIFSFGAEQGATTPAQGLNFSNLGLRISFPKATPLKRELDMVESEISFNVANSNPREVSLYRNFQLELLGLQSGDSTSTPQSLSFLTVATQYGLQGVNSGKWHGLRFKLNLGTPGALASKINLNSTMLLAWSDTSGATQGSAGYQAMAGIQLPGAGSGGDVFSLQSVLKLSIGLVQLFYNDTQKSFLLLLNEIALKFLGLLKVPPSGATAFFLFGNPNADSSTGLGWYAIYNQEQKKSAKPPALPADASAPPSSFQEAPPALPGSEARS